jgi:hypothetical protein
MDWQVESMGSFLCMLVLSRFENDRSRICSIAKPKQQSVDKNYGNYTKHYFMIHQQDQSTISSFQPFLRSKKAGGESGGEAQKISGFGRGGTDEIASGGGPGRSDCVS